MTYLLALDQGTTSTRAMIFDQKGRPVDAVQKILPQSFPNNGWVEHDAEQIWQDSLSCLQEVIKKAGLQASDIAAMGISNQRETTVVWDKHTGKPIAPAIVWQDRRTAQFCDALRQDKDLVECIADKTGLLVDPYFSATKIAWLLKHVSGAKEAADKGDLLFGTIDCFLLWKLTGGQSHITDMTNASRTMLFNIHTFEWDADLCDMFRVPKAMLPQVMGNCGEFGATASGLFETPIQITGMAGDQQAATVGQACFKKGMAKSTYGTGCFMLMNTGETALRSKNRLLTTIAYQIFDDIAYGLEGSIFVAGAAMQWLRDGMGILEDTAESENMARSVDNTGGVYLIPAFTGLGAPYWDTQARGALFGLTRNSSRAQIARAALESVAYQTKDLLVAMEKDGAQNFTKLRIDGGMANNTWFDQFLSDMLQLPIDKPDCIESSALGAAFLAGLGAGVYKDLDEVAALWHMAEEYKPIKTQEEAEMLYHGWLDCVSRIRTH